MSQKFYALKREVNGRLQYISSDDFHTVTDKPEKALCFFSENHIKVWKKCNPEYGDAIPANMLCYDDGTVIEET